MPMATATPINTQCDVTTRDMPHAHATPIPNQMSLRQSPPRPACPPQHTWQSTEINAGITTTSKNLNAASKTQTSVTFEIKSDGGALGLPEKPARLRHPDDDAVARFRERFKKYKYKIDDFNTCNGTHLKATIKGLVDESVRKQISRRYLHDHHQTESGQPINEQEVDNYILRTGEYENAGRDKPFVRDPITMIKGIKWDTKAPSLERRLANCMNKWDEIVDELGDNTCIQPKTLAPIMLQAVKPESLKKAIKDRMLTARPPDGDDTNTEKWRLRANKKTKYMYKLIRENARYADKQRARQTNMNEAISKQICRDYQNGRCRRGQHCPRIHQDGTANTQNTNLNTSTNTQQQTNI